MKANTDDTSGDRSSPRVSTASSIALNWSTFDLAQRSHWPSPNHRDMNKSDEPDQGEPKSSKPSRSEEAMRAIEEYANELREIIKKLRRRFFN